MRRKVKAHMPGTVEKSALMLSLRREAGCLYYGIPRGRYEWAADDHEDGCIFREDDAHEVRNLPPRKD